MYKNILVTLDNSRYSLWSLNYAMDMAEAFGGVTLVGNHVYAAKLHETRFVQMEPGLPPQYQEPDELQRQRDIHATLIDQGLQLISDSYLDVFTAKCEEREIAYEKKSMEGKNYSELMKDIRESSYELVTLGAKGLGEVETTQLGSVCERVARRSPVDTLITRTGVPLRGGRIVVCIDGSEQSFAGMETAIAFSRKLGCTITAISAFDPDFHYRAFDSIAEVLSEAAAEKFKFDEQEKLHNEIIDAGLEKIYNDHLLTAAAMATEAGVAVETELLSGKPYDEIIKWLDGKEIALMIMGKIGVHSDDELDIGSNSENLLRNASCNIMLVSRRVKPNEEDELEDPVEWTDEALEILQRAPGFVQNLIRGHMESNARKDGKTAITGDMMKKARENMGM